MKKMDVYMEEELQKMKSNEIKWYSNLYVRIKSNRWTWWVSRAGVGYLELNVTTHIKFTKFLFLKLRYKFAKCLSSSLNIFILCACIFFLLIIELPLVGHLCRKNSHDIIVFVGKRNHSASSVITDVYHN